MEEERGRIGGLIADAVENHHCHKGSFGWIRKLDRMDPAKRDEHLWNFMADLKSMGWDKIPDLFREQPLETSAEPASKPRRGPRVVGGSDAETRQEASVG
jgi:hypothetical protein